LVAPLNSSPELDLSSLQHNHIANCALLHFFSEQSNAALAPLGTHAEALTLESTQQVLSDLANYLVSPDSSLSLDLETNTTDKLVLARILDDLKPNGALCKELATKLQQQPVQTQRLFELIQSYVPRIINTGPELRNEVLLALSMFPPEDRQYLCLGGTMNRLIAAIGILESGPLRLLKNVYTSAFEKFVAQVDQSMPEGFEVHLPTAFHYLISSNPDKLKNIDQYFRTPIPYMSAAKIWDQVISLDQAPLQVKDAVKILVSNIDDPKKITLEQNTLYFKPWNLTAWDEENDYTSTYATQEKLTAAFFGQINRVLHSGDESKNIEWENINQVEQDLPNFENLKSHTGSQWLIQGLSRDVVNFSDSRTQSAAAQCLFLLSENLKDNNPYLALCLCTRLTANHTIQAGLDFLKTINTTPFIEERLQRVVDRVDYYCRTAKLLTQDFELGNDEQSLQLYGWLQGVIAPTNDFFSRFNCIDTDGNNVLHLFAKLGYSQDTSGWPVADNDQLLDQCNYAGDTPACLAAIHDNASLTYYLASQNADFTKPGQGGLTPVHHAARYDCVNVLQALEQGLANQNKRRRSVTLDRLVNLTYQNGRNAAHLAACKGQTRALEWLIEHGAKLDTADENGLTIASEAAIKGHIDILALLAKHQASFKVETSNEYTLLALGAIHGHLPVVKFMVEHDLDINKPNVLKESPVFLAAIKGRAEVIRFLASKGADLNATRHDGRNPAVVAIENQHSEALKVLIDNKAHLDWESTDGKTLANVAATLGNALCLDILANTAANLNKPDKLNLTPAMNAARNGHLEALKVLVREDVDLVLTGKDAIALCATESRNLEVVQFLASQGVDFNHANERGVTPAFIAAERGDSAILEVLVSLGVKLNMPTKEGFTPAYGAVCRNHHEIIQILAREGVKLNQTFKDGRTLAFIATQYGHVETIKTLFDHSADFEAANYLGETPVFAAVIYGQEQLIPLLAKRDVDLNKARTDGVTPAAFAAYAGSLPVLKLLAQHKVDLHQPAPEDSTLIHGAALYGHFEVVRYLVSQKVELNKQDVFGRTPAVMAAWQGHLEALQILVENGADLDIASYDGLTPLSLAITHYHFDVVDFIQAQKKSATSA